MMKSPIARWMIGIVVVLGVLGLLRFKPWQREGAAAGSQAAITSWISPGHLTFDVPGHGLRVQDQHVDSVRVAALY